MKCLKLVDDHLESFLGCVMLGAIVFLIMVQVVTRYALAAPPAWIEEAVGWIFVWCIWIGVSYGFKCRAHIKISFLSDMFGPKTQRLLGWALDILMIVFFAFLLYHTYRNMTAGYVWKQRSVVLDLPIPLMYASSVVGCFLVIVRILQNLYIDFFKAGGSHAG